MPVRAFSLCLLLIGLSLPVAAKEAPDKANITARSVKQGQRKFSHPTSPQSVVELTTRVQSVDVELFFFRKPSATYRVECFFIARHEADRELFIYETQVREGEEQKTKFLFEAAPLYGTSKESTYTPITLNVDGVILEGELKEEKTTIGARSIGWIVRVVSRGVVTGVESNQRSLKELAQKKPEIFDAAIPPD